LALVSTIYRRLAGYADLNDAARLSQDPAVASGIGGPQNAADFDDGIGKECLRTRSKKRQFWISYINARQNWPVAALWKVLCINPGSKLPICKMPGVGASLLQDSIWKSLLKTCIRASPSAGAHERAQRSVMNAVGLHAG